MKRLIISLVGFTILVLGILMIILPGPAVIFIPLGLGILATEFAWARKLLKRITENIKREKKKIEWSYISASNARN